MTYPGFGVVPLPATAVPLAGGTGAIGTGARYAREDHKHPGGESFIYQPGGTAGPNTFVTESALESAVAASSGYRRILVDTTYGAAVFSSVLNFDKTKGPVSLESFLSGVPQTVTFQTGAVLSGIYKFRDLNMVTTSNAPVFDEVLPNAGAVDYSFEGKTTVDTSGATAPLVKTSMAAGTGTARVNLRDEAVLSGASTKEAFEAAANVTATYTAYDRSNFASNSLRNVQNYTLNKVGPFAQGSATQTGAGVQTPVTNAADEVQRSLVGALKTTQQTTAPGETIGGGALTPSSMRANGTYAFRAQVYTTTGTAEVTLFDLTNNTTIATLTTTATSPDTQSVALTIGTPGTNIISNSLAKYEVRARFSAGSPGLLDQVVVESAEFVITYP